jgi:c-di-GMP-binding flagellar brake protein YcgR
MERINGMSALAERLERRHAERIAASGPVRFGLDGGSEFVSGQLMDLSTGGLRCVAEHDVPVRSGDHVVVHLDLAGDPVQVHAQVMHCVRQGAQTEVGMQFLTPPPDVVARIRRFVDSAG